MDAVRDAIVGTFTRQERVHFLAVLFRMAKADEVSIRERDRLQPIADWMKATPEELSDAMKCAYDLTLGLRDLAAGLTGGKKGLLLYREACAVVWVDARKSPAEEELLETLFSSLGLSNEAKLILDSPVTSSPEGERRFLEFLGGTSSSRNEGLNN